MKHTAVQAIKKTATKVSLLFTISFLFSANNANSQCNASSSAWCTLGNSGTTNLNFVGTTDMLPLIFKTNETEWMRISPTGNLGIFTNIPAYKLDVVGDINYTGALRVGTNPGTIGQVLTSTAGGANTWTTPTTGTVTTVSGTPPIFSSGGNIPTISITQANTSTNGFLSFPDWNTFNNKVNGSGTQNYMPKWTTNGNTLGNSLIYDDGTNIGIGTIIPQANLEIKNGSVLFNGAIGTTLASGPGTRFMWVPSKAAFRAGVVTGNTWDNVNIGTSSVAFGINTTAQSFAAFVVGRYNRNPGTYSTTAWMPEEPLFVVGNGENSQKTANALTVLKNGNVGIGTPTPVNRFDVSGEISIGGGYAGIKLAPANGAIIRGNVGVGTPTPTQKLEVNGNISITGVNSTLLFGQETVPIGKWGQWGIEYDNTNHGLNFWKPFGSNNFGNAFLFIKDDGNVGIGTNLSNNTYNNSYKLAVNGSIRAKEIVIETGWSDFVFAPTYKLMSLENVEKYIMTYNHLPDVPTSLDIATNGLKVAETQTIMMQKIEELTLYIIEQNKKLVTLQTKIAEIEKSK